MMMDTSQYRTMLKKSEHSAAKTIVQSDVNEEVGSLAYLLAAGKPLAEAIERANRLAAISVQSSGTQTSFPVAKNLPQELVD